MVSLLSPALRILETAGIRQNENGGGRGWIPAVDGAIGTPKRSSFRLLMLKGLGRDNARWCWARVFMGENECSLPDRRAGLRFASVVWECAGFGVRAGQAWRER